jgi:hypothetical protein
LAGKDPGCASHDILILGAVFLRPFVSDEATNVLAIFASLTKYQMFGINMEKCTTVRGKRW